MSPYLSPTRPPLASKTATSNTASATSSSSSLSASDDQIVVLYVMVCMIVLTFGCWNVALVRKIINPLKLFTIGLHELFHISTAILSGGRILRVTIDPYAGGATLVEGGRPTLILASGYIGSTLMGGLFVLAGWNILAAKVMSFFLGVGLIMPLSLVRDKLTIVLSICYEILLVGCWFIDHGSGLRWYCLFIGVMNVFFVVWDVADDRFFRKANDSDATQWSLLYPFMGPHTWTAIWILFEIVILAAFTLAGLFGLKQTPEQMYEQASHFLPT